MPISFSRLRIAGFKSFAEPVAVDIRPGLTGIVGPNGCGKSNVVEALRWAMGENSARSVRGDEMDDVIFAGTAARASRNIAEVTLHLDDARGLLPPPHHEAADIEVSRRIERGHGSIYRVNGKEARARDVQTLFADLATGSHSSGMVSQGRVAAIVNARPDERRMVLEEAAGITGLHARRHEAELKLRAAEANLARAEDLRGQLETQLEGLKRQARQANRYRGVSAAIRNAEAELLAVQRARVLAQRGAARAAFHDAESLVAGATAQATAATARAAEAAAALPALRARESEARTALERHRLAGEQIAAEAVRAREALEAGRARLRQIAADLAHAEQIKRDSDAAVARLAAEEERLSSEDTQHPRRFEAADAAVVATDDLVREAEIIANRATEYSAELAARHRAMSEAHETAAQRARRLDEAARKLADETAQARRDIVDPARVAAAQAESVAAGAALDTTRAVLDAAERARAAALQQAQQSRAAAQEAAGRLREEARRTTEQARRETAIALAAAREAAATAGTARARLAAEVQALNEVLAVKDGEAWPRMVDQLTVPAGLEAALGAALGEELESAADIGAARHWRDLAPLDPVPPLPQGVPMLASLVGAPAALGRALSQIGLAEDGGALQAVLLPGQMLVSNAGAVWRWDGYTIKAGTPTAAAVRLQQRNRLAGLKSQLAAQQSEEAAALAARAAAETRERAVSDDMEARESATRAVADTVEAAARAEAGRLEQEANAAEQAARAARRTADQRLEQARAAAASLANRASAGATRLDLLTTQATRLATERDEATAAFTAARAALAGLADPAEGRAAMERARSVLAEARGRETAARAERDTLARAVTGRAYRRRTIAAEIAGWRERAGDAALRVTDLAARAAIAHDEAAALVAAPAAIAARRGQTLDALEAAETAHRGEAERQVRAEAVAAEADRAGRAAEAALAAAREAVLRLESAVSQADAAWTVVEERIFERLGADAALPDAAVDIGPDSEEKLRRRYEKLLREREEMGPVNLRADIEAQEIVVHITTIIRERDELTTAIAKLRGSIGSLNREGRERLTAVFEQVDKHFQLLFSRMFGGGRAHLSMVGSDDPLLAGLEIFAQPPGKKLATLSLLSGGEQALTALSLIFAVFRCNPAPVCVLDEVDAPLDDANVERFCNLLEDMVKETATRFLVVTHHQLTMARMDRLYGVTMQERGVSRLLSVDLATAATIVEATSIAAE